MSIKDAILNQKNELERFSDKLFVERDVQLPDLTTDMIKVITGPRRSGKSYFAIHALQKEKHFGYVNFDDEALVSVVDYDDIVYALDQVYHQPKLIFMDEIQNLPRWELFVNRLQRQGYQLIISGSNANLLSQELSTHLTGRHLNIFIFPFSFREYLRLEKGELTGSKIQAKFNEYLNKGGFPEPLVKGLDQRDYLKTLLESIIYKDIIRRYKIRAVGRIAEMAKFITSNSAQLLSYRKLADLSGLKSEHTIAKYLGYFKECFLFFETSAFSFKVRRQVKSPKKIFVIDNGYLTAHGFQVFENRGVLFENIVAIELKKKALKGELDFYYYKTSQGYEVDFLIRENTHITQLIQVSCQMNDGKTREREIRALLHAGKELNCENLLIISDEPSKKETIEWFGIKRTVSIIPIWDWLLKKHDSSVSS
jgi:hypothetical protein